MTKEREGWAEEAVAKLRRAIAARKLPGLVEQSVMTADKGCVRLLFDAKDVEKQSDTELAFEIRYRVALHE